MGRDEWPMLMTGPNVLRIQDGLKTETRRLDLRWAKSRIGDIIWIRETWAPGRHGLYLYRADGERPGQKWKPCIFMPRDACRLRLRIVRATHVQQLQNIDRDSIRREGVPCDDLPDDPVESWKAMLPRWIEGWDRINNKPGKRWEDNPRVAVIRFEVAH